MSITLCFGYTEKSVVQVHMSGVCSSLVTTNRSTFMPAIAQIFYFASAALKCTKSGGLAQLEFCNSSSGVAPRST